MTLPNTTTARERLKQAAKAAEREQWIREQLKQMCEEWAAWVEKYGLREAHHGRERIRNHELYEKRALRRKQIRRFVKRTGDPKRAAKKFRVHVRTVYLAMRES